MDRIFHPRQRKWISPVTHLGESMEELKRFVRLRKDMLLIVDPNDTGRVPGASQSQQGGGSGGGGGVGGGGASTAGHGPGPRNSSAGYPGGGSSSEVLPNVRIKEEFDGDGHEFMTYEASNLDQAALGIIGEESQRLKEELEKMRKDKWAKDDKACEAAVNFVGGPDFFDLSDKKNKKKRRGRGRGKKVQQEEDIYEEDLEEEEEDYDDEDNYEGEEEKGPGRHPGPSGVRARRGAGRGRGRKSKKEKAGGQTKTTSYIVDEEDDDEEEEAVDLEGGENIYETYNSATVTIKEEPSSDGEEDKNKGGSSASRSGQGQVEEMEEDDEEPVTNILDQEFSAIRNILYPFHLKNQNTSAVEGADLDGIDFENDIYNFASAAERFETYKSKRPDLIHSDEEEEDEQNGVQINSSDDEGAYIEPDAGKGQGVGGDKDMDTSVAAGEVPAPPPAPKGKIPAKKMKEIRKRAAFTKILKQTSTSNETGEGSSSKKKGNAEGAGPSSSGIGGGTGNHEKEGPMPGPSATKDYRSDPVFNKDAGQDKDGVSEFKKFSDWVFDQMKKKDEENREAIRPDLMKKLNLSEKDVGYLQKITSANLCTVKGEVFQDEEVMKNSSMPLLAPPILPPSSTNLQSLAVFITHGDDPSCFPWKSLNVQQQINDDFANDEFMKRMEQQKKDMANKAMKNVLVDKEEDFLVQCLIYQATDPDDVLPDEIKLYIEPRPAYELRLLGSQTVKSLMEGIHCENDFVYMEEVSHPDAFVEDPNQFAKARFPSCVMLIHDTIYSSPDAEGKNYHEILNNWVKSRPEKNIGPFKSGDWNVQLKDLNLRFGMPYVYIHLGGCEHIVVFTKARLLHVEDYHLKQDYPKIHGMTRFKSVYCRVDNEYLARWAVLDCKDFPENPMLLCTECVLMYCYDNNQKKKRGNFRLYPFTQIANII